MKKHNKVSIANYIQGKYDETSIFTNHKSIDYNRETLYSFFSTKLREPFKINYLSSELKVLRPIRTQRGQTRSGLYLVNDYVISLSGRDINFLKISSRYYHEKITRMFNGDVVPYDRLQAWNTETGYSYE